MASFSFAFSCRPSLVQIISKVTTRSALPFLFFLRQGVFFCCGSHVFLSTNLQIILLVFNPQSIPMTGLCVLPHPFLFHFGGLLRILIFRARVSVAQSKWPGASSSKKKKPVTLFLQNPAFRGVIVMSHQSREFARCDWRKHNNHISKIFHGFSGPEKK